MTTTFAPRARSVSFLRGHVIGGLFFSVVMAATLLGYAALWHLSIGQALEASTDFGWIGLAAIIAGIIVHEALHLLGFWWFGAANWADLHYGIHWKCATPYAGCRAPMPIGAYRLACALPGAVVGLLPLVIGLVAGNSDLAFYGALFLGAAGGDALVIWNTRDLPAHAVVQDSKNRLGCEVTSIAKQL